MSNLIIKQVALTPVVPAIDETSVTTGKDWQQHKNQGRGAAMKKTLTRTIAHKEDRP